MTNDEVLEISKYMYENYPSFKEMFPRWNLLSLLDKNRDKIAVIKEGKFIKGAALYLKLTDNSLSLIDAGVINLKSPDTIRELIKENGDNIHFVGVLADGTRTILKGLKDVIKRNSPKTISWFKPDMDSVHFIKVRGELCRLSHSQQR